MSGVSDAVRIDCKQKKDGEGKSKKKDYVYVIESDGSDALISPWMVQVNNE